MEASSFMKLYREKGRARLEIKISGAVNSSSAALSDPEVELAEGEETLFELSLPLSDFSLKDQKTLVESAKPDRTETMTMTKPCSVPSTDHFSRNKVIPIEIGRKPHSPIAHLKSGPKFRAFSFKNPKPVESEISKQSSMPRYEKKESNKSFSVRFRDDEDIDTSFRKTSGIARQRSGNGTVSKDAASFVSSSSKRFFSLMKPLYAMTEKKQSMAYPATVKQRRNLAARIRTVRRHLWKSRSDSGPMSPAKRVDESLKVQQDSIQSAILHCKRSFHGSREYSMLSRSTSDSFSLEELSTLCSEDSYVFSRIASDSMSEISADSQRINLP